MMRRRWAVPPPGTAVGRRAVGSAGSQMRWLVSIELFALFRGEEFADRVARLFEKLI